MDMQWREQFERVEQRIQENLKMLRELNERMTEAIQDAQHGRSRDRDSPQR
jgi:hypothetical protein